MEKTKKSTGLKPCPFCGGAASLLQKELEEIYVLCHGCGAEYNSHRDKGQCAIDEWNDRVGNNWRKYPEERPEEDGTYLVYRPDDVVTAIQTADYVSIRSATRSCVINCCFDSYPIHLG